MLGRRGDVLAFCERCDGVVEEEIREKNYLNELCDCDLYTRWWCGPCCRAASKVAQEYQKKHTKIEFDWEYADNQDDEKGDWPGTKTATDHQFDRAVCYFLLLTFQVTLRTPLTAHSSGALVAALSLKTRGSGARGARGDTCPRRHGARNGRRLAHVCPFSKMFVQKLPSTVTCPSLTIGLAQPQNPDYPRWQSGHDRKTRIRTQNWGTTAPETSLRTLTQCSSDINRSP